MKVYTTTGLEKTSTDVLTTKGDLITHTGSVMARQGVGSNGQAVVANSALTNGIGWGVPYGVDVSQFVGTGTLDTRFTGAISGLAPGTGTQSVGVIRAYPVFIPRVCTFDRIMFEYTAAGTAGSVTRVGVYASSSATDPKPAALVYDGGEKATDATPAVMETTVSPAVTLTGPAIYWFVNFTGVAQPTLRTIAVGSIMPLLGWGSAGGAANNVTVTRTLAYAALPDPFGAISSIGTAAPGLVGIRLAT